MDKKVSVFIDASNLWEAQKIKGRMFDFIKLKKYLKDRFNTSNLEVYYYVAYPKDQTREHSLQGKHKFFVFLKKGAGFNVVKKPLKQIILEDGSIQEKGNLDVELTIDAVHTVEKYDTAVLFTGDSDFLPLINYIRNKNKKAYVYSTANNISFELRTGGDGYIDILNIKEDIWGADLRFKAQK